MYDEFIKAVTELQYQLTTVLNLHMATYFPEKLKSNTDILSKRKLEYVKRNNITNTSVKNHGKFTGTKTD